MGFLRSVRVFFEGERDPSRVLSVEEEEDGVIEAAVPVQASFAMLQLLDRLSGTDSRDSKLAARELIALGEEAVAALIESVDRPGSNNNRIADVLVRIKPEGRNRVLRWSQRDDDLGGTALWALGQSWEGEQDLIPRVAHSLARDKHVPKLKRTLAALVDLIPKIEVRLGADALLALHPIHRRVVKLIDHEDDTLGSTAAQATGLLKPEAAWAIPVLANAVADPINRRYASAASLKALSAYGPAAAPALDALIDRISPNIDVVTLYVLHSMGPAARPAVPHLEDALERLDQRRDGEKRRIGALIRKTLRSIDPKPTSRSVKRKRAKKGDPRLLDLLQRLKTQDDLVMHSSAESVSQKALHAVRNLDDPSLLPSIEELFEKRLSTADFGNLLRILTAVTLNSGQNRGREMAKRLLDREGLKEANWEDLAKACSELEIREAVPRIREQVRQGILHKSLELKHFLKTFPDPEIVALIGRKAVEDRQESQCLRLRALLEARSSAAVPYAEAILGADDLGYRKTAHIENKAISISIISEMGGPKSIGAILAELNRCKRHTCLPCLRALDAIGDERGVESAKRALARVIRWLSRGERMFEEQEPSVFKGLRYLRRVCGPDDPDLVRISQQFRQPEVWQHLSRETRRYLDRAD